MHENRIVTLRKMTEHIRRTGLLYKVEVSGWGGRVSYFADCSSVRGAARIRHRAGL